VKWVELDQGDVSEHGSTGLYLVEAARLTTDPTFRTHIAYVAPGGVLGLHPTRFWQLFYVVEGDGWVRVDGGERQPIRARESVLWAPGDVHESGTDYGMTAVMVQSSVPLPYGR
jgi:quercetin dioxygenase-like cupin family protein